MLQKRHQLFLLISICAFCIPRNGSASPTQKNGRGTSDFGGDFSAGSLSGADAPGPSSDTMGNKAASAMAIGTGGMGAGDYTSSYKTPNYTQYTQQDFKEFMPNYQDMMESSLGASKSSFGNFTQVNDMLKGFMELQKEQIEVEKAKAEADKAKLNLAMDYDFEDSSSNTPGPENSAPKRIKRSKTENPYITSYKISPVMKQMSPTKIRYPNMPSATMHINSMGLLDSTPPPEEQFIKPSSSSPETESYQKKLTFEEKEKVLDNILEGLIALSKKKEKPEPIDNPTAMSKGGSTLPIIPVVGQQLNDFGLKNTLVKLSGKMMNSLKPRQAPDWSSYMGGGSSGQGGSSMMGSAQKWTSSNRLRSLQRQTGSVPPPPPAAQSQSSSSSGGPPPSFWEKFSSMFGSGAGAGSQVPPTQSGTSQDSQTADPINSPPPSWGYSAPPTSSGQAVPGPGGCASQVPGQASQQGSQRKRSLANYPMHGGVSLSNIPYTEEASGMPFHSTGDASPMSQMGENVNIPSLSFSINPQPAPAVVPAAPIDSGRRLPIADEPSSNYVLSKRPSFGQPMMNPSGPIAYASVPEQPVIYMSPAESSQVYPINSQPVFYLAPSTSEVVYDSGSAGPLNLYRISRGLEDQPDDPIIIYSLKKDGKTTKEVKKILLDQDHGIIITQTQDDSKVATRGRQKRSVEEVTEGTTSKPTETEATSEKNLNQDPNGHSHYKNDQMSFDEFFPVPIYDDSSLKRDSYQAQTSGGSVDYDEDKVQVEGDDKKRSVKIGLTQSTSALPDGTVETISAGGGRSPGHHEGGGLTVEVTTPSDVVARDIQERKERKTLNFFFTW